MKCGNIFLFAVPDQSPTATSTRYQRTKPQGVSHTAAGSRASSASPNIERISSANLGRMERSVCFIYITVIYLTTEKCKMLSYTLKHIVKMLQVFFVLPKQL